jgi:hypothetical protein
MEFLFILTRRKHFPALSGGSCVLRSGLRFVMILFLLQFNTNAVSVLNIKIRAFLYSRQLFEGTPLLNVLIFSLFFFSPSFLGEFSKALRCESYKIVNQIYAIVSCDFGVTFVKWLMIKQ